MVFKCVNHIAPDHLSDIIHPYHQTRNLRSNFNNDVTIPRVKYPTLGERSFAHAGPFLWNQLPLSLKETTSLSVFKKRLKTHLF